jgi:hypothetical protein
MASKAGVWRCWTSCDDALEKAMKGISQATVVRMEEVPPRSETKRVRGLCLLGLLNCPRRCKYLFARTLPVD